MIITEPRTFAHETILANGTRSIYLITEIAPVPYTRQTHATAHRDDRYGAAVRLYNTYTYALGEAIKNALSRHSIAPFGKEALAVAVTFTIPKGKMLSYDLDNLLKGVLDACNKGVLWADDRYIVRINECEKKAATEKKPCGIHLDVEDIREAAL